MTQSCRTCLYLEVPPDKDGKRRVRDSNGYRCLAPIPPIPNAMPISAIKTLTFRWPTQETKRWVDAKEGADCGAWRPRA